MKLEFPDTLKIMLKAVKSLKKNYVVLMYMAIHRITALPTCFVLSCLMGLSGTFTPGLLRTKLPLSQGVIHNTHERIENIPPFQQGCALFPVLLHAACSLG